MKRLISAILSFVLLFLCVAAAAETSTDTSTKEFTASFTTSVDYNAKEWMQSELNRALFTVTILMDYILTLEDGEEMPFNPDILSNTTYVGRNGFIILTMVLSPDKKQAIIVLYHTVTHEAGWFVNDCSSQLSAEVGLEAICTDGYYKNDVTDVYTVYTELSKAFGLD